jgi:hypothetical protein
MKKYADWPVVDATLRSGVIVFAGEGVALVHFLEHLLPIALVFVLPILAVRGHRANFLYTYVVKGKYYTGIATRFVRGKNGEPDLCGCIPNDPIRIRYNPEKPNLSVVLEVDNPR